MIRGTGRRPLTCHHEAGHALARWYFGHSTDRAVVLSIEEVRAGKHIVDRKGQTVECEGIVEGYDIIGFPFGPVIVSNISPQEQVEFTRVRSINRDVELINCMAGAYAEAQYRRRSVVECLLSGGGQDLEHFRTVIAAWGLPEEESRTVELQAEDLASALVRSPMGGAAIQALADRLLERGEVEGAEVAALFRQAYGGRECAYGAWNDHWPPTPQQVRFGFIPEAKAIAA